MFPFTVSTMANFIDAQNLAYIGLFLQLFLSFLNTLMIYRVGKSVFGKIPEAERIAELSARFYVVSHSAVYQVAFYSENLFLFLSLFGLSIIYSGK